ncbi:hypothetical protein DPMN_151224 [Dreissena polymorpha]|uniref:Uncharacterized protein n=1 Tax=Dreissena polymorpha TaxID=45954 RepID=A0A9D4FJI2_DREPO|nr:hypothetical protein DPMN_151224 [Dreissena polymorpha]
MNLLTKFHEDRTVNVASRVKNAPPLGNHTNLLTKFHEVWTINVASRVLTSRLKKNAPPLMAMKNVPPPWWPYIIRMNFLTEFHEDRTINVDLEKNALPLGSHVFQANVTIFELIQDINKTNLLTIFHDDWK